MNDTLATTRDIRLKLANLLDQLGQLSNTQAWETTTLEHPSLTEQFQEAQTTLDALWYSFRCATTTTEE